MPPESSAPSAERGPARPRPADVAARPDAPSPRATALLFALAVAAGSAVLGLAGAVFAVPVLAFVNSFIRALTADPPEQLTDRSDQALAPGSAADEAVGSHVFEPTKHDDAALASEDDAGTSGDLR